MTEREINELKAGDLVVCNTPNIYSITDIGVPCEFIRTYDPIFDIVDETDNYESDVKVGLIVKLKGDKHCFGVNPAYFSRLYPTKEVEESELTALFL